MTSAGHEGLGKWVERINAWINITSVDRILIALVNAALCAVEPVQCILHQHRRILRVKRLQREAQVHRLEISRIIADRSVHPSCPAVTTLKAFCS